MERSENIQPILFEKDYYTLPEAIEHIFESFGVKYEDIKAGKYTAGHKTIYQHVRRKLISMPAGPGDIIAEEDKRKTLYSKAILHGAVNGDLYPWLSATAERITEEEFQNWKKERKQNPKSYDDRMVMTRMGDSQLGSSTVEKLVDDIYRRRRLEIAMDYIFSELVELDEQLLRQDIEIDLTFDEFDPSMIENAARERLMDHKNYYRRKDKNKGE